MYTYYVLLHFVETGQATFFSAICVEAKGLPKIQIQVAKNPLKLTELQHQLQMIINGAVTDISQIKQDSNSTQELDGVSGLTFKRSNVSVTVYFNSGLSLDVAIASVSLFCKTEFDRFTFGRCLCLQ